MRFSYCIKNKIVLNLTRKPEPVFKKMELLGLVNLSPEYKPSAERLFGIEPIIKEAFSDAN